MCRHSGHGVRQSPGRFIIWLRPEKKIGERKSDPTKNKRPKVGARDDLEEFFHRPSLFFSCGAYTCQTCGAPRMHDLRELRNFYYDVQSENKGIIVFDFLFAMCK